MCVNLFGSWKKCVPRPVREKIRKTFDRSFIRGLLVVLIVMVILTPKLLNFNFKSVCPVFEMFACFINFIGNKTEIKFGLQNRCRHPPACPHPFVDLLQFCHFVETRFLLSLYTSFKWFYSVMSFFNKKYDFHSFLIRELISHSACPVSEFFNEKNAWPIDLELVNIFESAFQTQVTNQSIFGKMFDCPMCA